MEQTTSDTPAQFEVLLTSSTLRQRGDDPKRPELFVVDLFGLDLAFRESSMAMEFSFL